MKKIIATSLSLITVLSLVLTFSVAPLTLASTVEGEIFDTLGPSAEVFGQPRDITPADATTALAEGVAQIIQVALSLLGIILIVLILYAGFLWMTAGGNDEKISKAKKIIGAAIIGLAIILSAYLITAFVIRQLLIATGAN